MAFVSGRSGPQQIYRMSMDGTDVQRLTNGEGEASNPAWHPNGQVLAFSWTTFSRPAIRIRFISSSVFWLWEESSRSRPDCCRIFYRRKCRADFWAVCGRVCSSGSSESRWRSTHMRGRPFFWTGFPAISR